jgi:hypothetical protein
MRSRNWLPPAMENKPGLRRVLEGMHRLHNELQQCDEDDLPVLYQERVDTKDPPSLH